MVVAALSRALATLVIVLTSCMAAPPTTAPSSALTADASAVRATLEARFGTLTPGPASGGSVWSADQPVTLEPRAFGAFPADRQPGAFFSFDRVRLATALPPARDAAPVALLGSYDEAWRATVARTVTDPSAWDVVPLYASLSSLTSLGPMPSFTAAGADAARTLLQRNGLLLPDMEPHPHPGRRPIRVHSPARWAPDPHQ